MKDAVREKLEREFRNNPPGDLTDSKVVRQMCKQNDEAMRPVLEQMDRMAAISRAQMFTKAI